MARYANVVQYDYIVPLNEDPVRCLRISSDIKRAI